MRKLLIFISAITLSLACYGQQQPEERNILLPKNQKQRNPWDGFTYGGGIGGSIGSNLWGISLSPRLGYKLSEEVELAFSVNYYFQQNQQSRYHSVSLGPSLNYYIARNFYAKASYQHYFITQKIRRSELSYRIEEDALLLGGGYMQALGSNSYLRIGFSYNVLYDKDKSIFSSGLVPEIGFVIGL